MKGIAEAIAKVMALDPERRQTVPLRLEVAAQIAFPDGTMAASGLRREREKGRLITEIIAGKEFTTLAEIESMREKCRVQAMAPSPRSEVRAARTFKTEDANVARAAARASLQKLRDGSRGGPMSDAPQAATKAILNSLKSAR